MSDQCRSCGAEVIFVPSAKTGKPMILDAKPEKRIVVAPTKVEEPHDCGHEGCYEVYTMTLARVMDTYVDHHATCPAAKEWQGRRRGNR